MNDKTTYIEEIISLLKRYQNDILAGGKFNLLNSHIHAEYFLKQLFNHIAPTWKLRHTSEYYSHNTSSIDLFSDEAGFVVQITAQTTNLKQKIENTIDTYNRDWKLKYPELRIFFIKDVSKDLKNEFQSDKIKIRSFDEIITRIQSNFTTQQAYKLLDFLRQELGRTYGSPYSFECIEPFEKIKDGNENSVFSNIVQYRHNLLFYSEEDNLRIQTLHGSLLKNKATKVLLEGPPCAGKTTLTFELVNRISRELIKTFYIDLTNFDNNYSEVKKDIDKISVHDALLIIDNAQENFDLAKNIYRWLSENQIRAVFISRFIANAHSSASFFNYDFEEKLNLNDDFSDDTVLKAKIDGIIQQRLKYLTKKHPHVKWIMKDREKVYHNCELNFLKLSITLYFWETKYQGFLLEQIGTAELYTSFYEEHNLQNHDDRTVFKYATLYKYDYPFHLSNIDDRATSELIEKGIIIKRKFYEQYFFPHVEYANLLTKAIIYKREYTNTREAEAIVEYIKDKKPQNIHVLLNSLGRSRKIEIIEQILDSESCTVFINQHYHSKSVSVSDIGMLFFFINEFRTTSNALRLKEFCQSFILATPYTVFHLYEKEGFNAFQNLTNCITNYALNTTNLSKFYIAKNSTVPKKAEGKTFFEISELVSTRKRDPKFVYSLINTFTYPEWQELFNNQMGFSLTAEGLNNLRKNTLSRQLAVDLYNELDIIYSFNQLKGAEIDIIGKALSDLSEFDATDYKSKPRQILKMLFEGNYLNNSVKSGLSKFAIGIGHLSKVDKEVVEAIFPTLSEIDMLFSDASANDFAQRIPLFVKHFPAKKTVFIDAMKKTITNENFVTSEKNDLNGIIKLIELLQNPAYPFSKAEINTLKELAIKKLSADESLVHLSDAIHKLKSILTEDNISTLISPKRISQELLEGKISIKHLETILIQNIKHANPRIAYNIYTNISIEALVKASITSNFQTAVSFEQMTKDFMLFQNLECSYLKNIHVPNSFTANLFLKLTQDAYSGVMFKAQRANMYDFLIGYTRLFKIDSYLTEKTFSQLLIQRSKGSITGEITLSNFTQPIRQLAKLRGAKTMNYKLLAEDILHKSKYHLIKSAEHLDIGKISTGLKELSFEFADFSETLFYDLRLLIIEKGKKEAKRHDFKSRVIPELKSCAGKHVDIISELNLFADKIIADHTKAGTFARHTTQTHKS